ncbi:hypothetical protein TGVAND_438960, partial [Toxoplasma gondii VAND]
SPPALGHALSTPCAWRRHRCEEVTVWESECPAWDAWTNPVAEANDPSALVSEYAACGVWRPHMALPFSRMSLVAYLRGWVRVCLGDGRAYCPGAGGKGAKGPGGG